MGRPEFSLHQEQDDQVLFSFQKLSVVGFTLKSSLKPDNALLEAETQIHISGPSLQSLGWGLGAQNITYSLAKKRQPEFFFSNTTEIEKDCDSETTE